jgi:hypothetical protein
MVYSIIDKIDLFKRILFRASGEAETANVFLCLSAIFISFSILQYFSISESHGKLVLMLFKMTKDLIPLAVIYVICMIGFMITLRGIYDDVPVEDDTFENSFRSLSKTVYVLFAATLGNYDSTFDSLYSDHYRGIGAAIIVCYVVFTGIVLLSLVVAR